MPNPNPHKARMAQIRTRKPGDLPALQRVLWRAVRTAERLLEEAVTREQTVRAFVADREGVPSLESLQAGEAERSMQLRAIHAISQCSGQYSKLLEIGEHEARLAALEQALAEKGIA